MLSMKLAAMRGVTLIEMMIAIAVVALLMAFALPGYQTWLQNTQVRTAAESIQNGLQLARTEAVRRNAPVEFLLTDIAPIAANVNTATASGTENWMVRAGTAGAYEFIQGRSKAEGSRNATITFAGAASNLVTFNALGRVTPVPAGAITLDASSASGTCESAGGTIRCLRVVVTSGGQIRMCDPKLTLTVSPQACS